MTFVVIHGEKNKKRALFRGNIPDVTDPAASVVLLLFPFKSQQRPVKLREIIISFSE